MKAAFVLVITLLPSIFAHANMGNYLSIHRGHLSAQEILGNPSYFWDTTKANVEGFSKLFPVGSTIRFRADLPVSAEQSRAVNGINFARESTGSSYNRRYFFSCALEMEELKEGAIISSQTPFKVANVTYDVQLHSALFNVLGGVIGISIKFADSKIKSMNCKRADTFTGFDYQVVTPYEFLQVMNPYIEGSHMNAEIMKPIR